MFRELVTVVPVDDKVISAALNAGFSDFEDAVQYRAELAAKIRILLTRNVRDYRKPAIAVFTAEEYLARRRSAKS